MLLGALFSRTRAHPVAEYVRTERSGCDEDWVAVDGRLCCTASKTYAVALGGMAKVLVT